MNSISEHGKFADKNDKKYPIYFQLIVRSNDFDLLKSCVSIYWTNGLSAAHRHMVKTPSRRCSC